jgi:hypothetical protein
MLKQVRTTKPQKEMGSVNHKLKFEQARITQQRFFPIVASIARGITYDS